MKPVHIADGVWVGYHLVYQGSLDSVVVDLVRPLACSLWRQHLIKKFFFIRYYVGGPHIRLRLDSETNSTSHIDDYVSSVAQAYFEHRPSRTLLTESDIRKTNQSMLIVDPFAEDVAYPNNSIQRVQFLPEVSRYGGYDHLSDSLSLFAFSSIWAIQSLTFAPLSRGDILWNGLRSLLQQAVGFADNDQELLAIVEQPLVDSGNHLNPIKQKACAEFLQKKENFMRGVAAELSLKQNDGYCLSENSVCHQFSHTLRKLSPDKMHSIITDHIHMTANRLGLSNLEEVYISKLLSLCLRALITEHEAVIDKKIEPKPSLMTVRKSMRGSLTRALSGLCQC